MSILRKSFTPMLTVLLAVLGTVVAGSATRLNKNAPSFAACGSSCSGTRCSSIGGPCLICNQNIRKDTCQPS